MNPRHLIWVLGLCVLSGCATRTDSTPQSRAKPSTTGVHIIQASNSVRVEINGELFTEYNFKNYHRPYFYPVLGPGESPMTRDWPMKEKTNEEHDHLHHRGLWYGHGSVNGIDFWTDPEEVPQASPKYGDIVHTGFTELKSGQDSGVIRSTDKWVGTDGKVVLTDERTFRVYNRPANERMFDFEITFHASNGDVTFGDTKEGSMAMRVAESMRLKKPGQGHIINSNGVLDDAAWAKRADWVDYYGPVNGKTVGIAMFDHPGNPRHPTTWHVRDYGLFAANPFGLHDFEKKPAKAGDLLIPSGQSVTFRYRFYLHEGNEKDAGVAAKYADYAKTK